MQESPLNDTRPFEAISANTVARYLNPKTMDNLLSDSIDRVLNDVLGRRAKEAVYDYMERNHSVAREEIPKNIESFFALMNDVFGKGGKTIARCVVKHVWSELGWKFVDIPGFEFPDYLDAARARLARQVVERTKAGLLDK